MVRQIPKRYMVMIEAMFEGKRIPSVSSRRCRWQHFLELLEHMGFERVGKQNRLWLFRHQERPDVLSHFVEPRRPSVRSAYLRHKGGSLHNRYGWTIKDFEEKEEEKGKRKKKKGKKEEDTEKKEEEGEEEGRRRRGGGEGGRRRIEERGAERLRVYHDVKGYFN